MSSTSKHIEYRLVWPNGQVQGEYASDEIRSAHQDLMKLLRDYNVPSEYFPRSQARVIKVETTTYDWVASSAAEHLFREGDDEP